MDARLSDAEVRSVFRQVDVDIGVQAVQPTDAILGTVLGPAAFVARMLSLLGAAGLVLLALGIFGAVAVQLRAALREIGVRQSLGATPIRASAGPLRILTLALIGGAAAGVALTPLALGASSQLGLSSDASAFAQAAVALVVVRSECECSRRGRRSVECRATLRRCCCDRSSCSTSASGSASLRYAVAGTAARIARSAAAERSMLMAV